MCIGEFQLKPDLHLFELGGIDVVLGMEWLKTLGDTIMNWRKQNMRFWTNQKRITLHETGGGDKLVVALQSILRKGKRETHGGVWGIEKQMKREEQVLSVLQQKELKELLQSFSPIFKEPSGLPPKRDGEHAINLVEGQNAVNVRPYRYPTHHKNEIEKQIKEMLAIGIIRHSTSSFSSRVIEVLLDELNGARFYSKLDLKSGYHQEAQETFEMLKVKLTDQKSLKKLMQQGIVTAEQQNWAAKLIGYDFDIVYKQGKLNKGPDALSRMGEEEFHSTPRGGHSGFYKTYRRVAANVYWVGMKSKIQGFVRSCDVCQRQKYLTSSPGGLLQPLPIPSQIWEDISIDFITGLPKSKGYETILVVVDRL
ncbi:retrotransposon-related protein [Trifolium pratense]|uniref:Retrotransposon-related protein n=1 Tax=Trifolium pratense TaxID=57577 RepID=A0A2K3MZ48_TRIPR|nr:retrotransposon-related protein [Trifolium pratense]